MEPIFPILVKLWLFFCDFEQIVCSWSRREIFHAKLFAHFFDVGLHSQLSLGSILGVNLDANIVECFAVNLTLNLVVELFTDLLI